MPSRHGPGSYANKRHDICYQKRSKAAACEGTPRIARVSFPHGLASEAQLRSASFVASRCYAINFRGSQFISKDCAASTAQWDTRIVTGSWLVRSFSGDCGWITGNSSLILEV